MTDLFSQLFCGGVLLCLAGIFFGIPYIESRVAEEPLGKPGNDKIEKKAPSGSPVPTLVVVEHVSSAEQPEQKKPIPLAA